MRNGAVELASYSFVGCHLPPTRRFWGGRRPGRPSDDSCAVFLHGGAGFGLRTFPYSLCLACCSCAAADEMSGVALVMAPPRFQSSGRARTCARPKCGGGHTLAAWLSLPSSGNTTRTGRSARCPARRRPGEEKKSRSLRLGAGPGSGQCSSCVGWTSAPHAQGRAVAAARQRRVRALAAWRRAFGGGGRCVA